MKIAIKVQLFSLLLLTTSFFILNIEGASSAVKAGVTCGQNGQTKFSSGKKFTCIKVGKRLTWNQGVVLAAKKSPMPSASAAPKEINEHKLVISQISDQWQKWRLKSATTYTPLQMLLEPGYDANWNDAAKASNLLISTFTGNGYQLVQTPYSILGDTEEWLASTGRPIACGRKVPEQALGIYCGHIQLGFGYFMVNATQEEKFIGRALSKKEFDLINYLTAHDVATMYELQAQYGSIPYDGTKNQIPAWIREGFVQLFAALAISDTNPVKKNYYEYILSANLLEGFPTKLCAKTLQDFESRDRNWGGSCVSSQNFYGVELLAARHGGLDALFKFVTEFGATDDWPTSFKSAFAITREEFYKEWYAYLKIPTSDRPALTPAAPSVRG